MQADDCRIVVACTQLRTQVAHGADARKNRDFAAGQQRKKLLRAAEKAGVSGENDGKGPAFGMRADRRSDVLRGNGVAGLLPGTRDGVQHALRADETVGFLNCLADGGELKALAAGTDAGKEDLRG